MIRLDLTETELNSCLDSPINVDGQRVEAINSYVPGLLIFYI